jgi:hypothetical protein
VIYTFNETACLAILKATISSYTLLVVVIRRNLTTINRGVGLNGDNIIGVVGKVEGFEVANNDTPAYYDVLQPSIKNVAEGVAKEYRISIFGVVECTEVGAYTDIIRAAMGVPLYDPIHMACVDHGYDQLNSDDRNAFIEWALSYPVNPDFFIGLTDEKENNQ